MSYIFSALIMIVGLVVLFNVVCIIIGLVLFAIWAFFMLFAVASCFGNKPAHSGVGLDLDMGDGHGSSCGEDCPECMGLGYDSDDGVACSTCGGEGSINED